MATVYVEGTAQFAKVFEGQQDLGANLPCLLYTSPSPRD